VQVQRAEKSGGPAFQSIPADPPSPNRRWRKAERGRHEGTKTKLSYEIEVTPDVSIVVKGRATEDEFGELKLRRFELIAERLRELLSSPPEDIESLAKRLKDFE